MKDKQSRLNRWGARVIPSRPQGDIHTCKLVAKFDDNRHIYVMLEDESIICVDIPAWYREELKGKHEYVNLCWDGDQWVYHSIKEETD